MNVENVTVGPEPLTSFAGDAIGWGEGYIRFNYQVTILGVMTL